MTLSNNERGFRMVCELRTIRKAKGMTQEALATASGVNRVSIAKYETGRALPSVNTAGKLAKALNVSISEIVKAG